MRNIENEVWRSEWFIGDRGEQYFEVVRLSDTVRDELIAKVEEKEDAELISLLPVMVSVLKSIQGIEAFITDPQMKLLFQNKINLLLEKINKIE